jgi:poly(hydroxyalkanoate) depolymerase family esterase
MNSSASSEAASRRRAVHRMVADLASLDPDSEDYERKLMALGDHIAEATSGEVQRRDSAETGPRVHATDTPTWRARWLTQKARLAHAGRALLRTMRRATFRRPQRPAGPGCSTDADRASSLAAEADTRALPAGSEARPTGHFTTGIFGENHFGNPLQRAYMLYEPASRKSGPAPLLVMLHGCRQTAADFAAGTRMNEAAEDAAVIVLYPEQSLAASVLRCWNWYALQDRSNDAGDAALIAAMTRQVIREHDIDATRVYVAGMSAGGGMAAVLARDYPELYAALGVHSGVPAGRAHDVFTAMRLMSSGPAPAEVAAVPPLRKGVGPAVASIVFHGDEDTVVHPANGRAIHAAVSSAPAWMHPLGPLQATTDPIDGQRGFTRSVEFGQDGTTKRELWIVHGAGHAWAGGSKAERHTDASGPNASREMLRFFLQHRLAG